jgi:hypothetical protein
MVRDAEALRQHLQLAGEREYLLFVARRSGRPIGYALLRVMPRGSLRSLPIARIGLLADFLVSRTDTTTLRQLIVAGCQQLTRRRVGVVLSLASDPGHQAVFRRLGFTSPRKVMGEGLRGRLSSRCMHAPLDGSAMDGNWHLTFADNDTDLILGVEITRSGSFE